MSDPQKKKKTLHVIGESQESYSATLSSYSLKDRAKLQIGKEIREDLDLGDAKRSTYKTNLSQKGGRHATYNDHGSPKSYNKSAKNLIPKSKELMTDIKPRRRQSTDNDPVVINGLKQMDKKANIKRKNSLKS